VLCATWGVFAFLVRSLNSGDLAGLGSFTSPSSGDRPEIWRDGGFESSESMPVAGRRLP